MPTQNIQAYNVPINLSNDIFPNADGQITESSLWGNQDIALPGEVTGDGVIDNGVIPLRMILEPTNSAEYTITASDIYMEEFGGYPSGSLTTANPYISAGKYEPTSTEYEDNLYPGYTGGSVLVREWINGASTTLTDGTAATINLWPNGQTIYSKVKVFDFNFSTNSAGTPGTVGNKVVVLAYVNPEHDILTNTAPVFLTANELTTNDMADGLIAYKLYIDGTAMPIVADVGGETTNVTTSTSGNSWTLTLEAKGGVNSNFSIIPYLPGFSMYSGGSATYDGYGYQTSWDPAQPYKANITFTPSNVWWEGSVALPEPFNALKSIFFWIVPNEGYVLSRHNLSVNRGAVPGGNTTYFDYEPISGVLGTGTGGQWYSNSEILLQSQYQNTVDDVFGPSVPQSFVQTWKDGFPSSIQQSINYEQLTNHPYEVIGGYGENSGSLTSSWRGATKYYGVRAWLNDTPFITSEINNTDDFNAYFLETPLSDYFTPSNSVGPPGGDPDVTLIDSKQYTLGIPILGQFITSVENEYSALSQLVSFDTGVEWSTNTPPDGYGPNGTMPEQYCVSDWVGNAVLVNLNNLHNYVPGADPDNIRILINGEATALDGQQCLPFSIDLSGGVDIG